MNEPPVSLTVVDRVPGGGQEASVRKPVLPLAAERPSVITGGSVSTPLSTPSSVWSKKRSSSGCQFGAPGVEWPACHM